MKAPDGTSHLVHAHILAEARDPDGLGNAQATPMTIELAQKMAEAALVAMHDTRRAIAEKLTSQSGASAAPEVRRRVHKATIGAHVMNDHVESNFGSYDYIGHIFRGMAVHNAAGMTQQMRNADFERPANVVSDRRKRKPRADGDEAPAPKGFFYRGLCARLQESLVLYARHEVVAARKQGGVELAAHDAAKLKRREERVITLLNKAVEDFAYSKEL